MKPIIKNKDKFKLLKLANGLWLDEYEVEKRYISKERSTGVSTERFGTKWFLTPKGRALFKNYKISFSGLRIVNELIYDELAKQVGLPVAKYLPAQYKSYPLYYMLRTDKDQIEKPEPDAIYYGLASIDVTKRNEEIFDGGELLDYDGFYGNETFVDYLKALDNFKEGEGYYVDKRNIKSTLFKMMVLDALTFMDDRNYGNVPFIKNNKDGYLIASPIIDNEMCFAGKVLFYNINDEMQDVDLNQLLELHGSEMRLVVNDHVRKTPAKYRYKENVKAIVELASKSKSMKKFLLSAIEEIDIKTAIENVEKLGYEISPEYKEYVIKMISISKRIFKKYIKELDQSQDNHVLPAEISENVK